MNNDQHGYKYIEKGITDYRHMHNALWILYKAVIYNELWIPLRIVMISISIKGVLYCIIKVSSKVS